MHITHLDHLSLTVRDIDTTCHFYTSVLGMKQVVFGQGKRALVFGNQKIVLHQVGYNPGALHTTTGLAKLCFIASTPLEQVLHELYAMQITIEKGIVEGVGVTGRVRSIYFRDPDGNLLEVSNYI